MNAAATDVGGDDAYADRFNAALMAAARALIPVNYTLAGPYGVDLALENPILPGLAPVAALAMMDPGKQ